MNCIALRQNTYKVVNPRGSIVFHKNLSHRLGVPDFYPVADPSLSRKGRRYSIFRQPEVARLASSFVRCAFYWTSSIRTSSIRRGAAYLSGIFDRVRRISEVHVLQSPRHYLRSKCSRGINGRGGVQQRHHLHLTYLVAGCTRRWWATIVPCGRYAAFFHVSHACATHAGQWNRASRV